MSIGQSVGCELLAKILQEERLQDFLVLHREYFYKEELTAYDFIHKFYKDHGTLPSVETTAKKTRILRAVTSKDPYGYFHDEYANRALFNQFQAVLPRVGKALEKRDMDKAVLEISSLLEQTQGVRANAQRDLTTVKDVGRQILAGIPERRAMSGMTGIPTGWPTLNSATGGLQPGDLYVVLARHPKMGKSITMFHMANACYNAGRIPLVVSMEMRKEQVAGRIIAARAHLNMNYVKTGQLDYWATEKFRIAVDDMEQRQPFYLIEGQFRKSVEEVGALVHGLHPDALYLDGGYLLKLLKNTNNKMARHERMEEIAQELKTLVSTAHIPGVISFQYNRNVKSGATSAGFEDIQLSDAIGQLASVGIGIYEDPDGDSEINPTRRYAEIVGGREGETGGFKFNWLWETMDFSEIPGSGRNQLTMRF